MQTDSFAGMFDQNADQWARQEPMILSDFTARPLVLQELAPVKATHVLDLGRGEGYATGVAEWQFFYRLGRCNSGSVTARFLLVACPRPCSKTLRTLDSEECQQPKRQNRENSHQRGYGLNVPYLPRVPGRVQDGARCGT
jgi:hypothetical protein